MRQSIRSLVKEIYKISLQVCLTKRSIIRLINTRSCFICKLSIAERSSRKSTSQRSRHYEESRGAVAKNDAVLETAVDLNYPDIRDMNTISGLLNQCSAILSKNDSAEKL